MTINALAPRTLTLEHIFHGAYSNQGHFNQESHFLALQIPMEAGGGGAFLRH